MFVIVPTISLVKTTTAHNSKCCPQQQVLPTTTSAAHNNNRPQQLTINRSRWPKKDSGPNNGENRWLRWP